jgi:hypothetical protein
MNRFQKASLSICLIALIGVACNRRPVEGHEGFAITFFPDATREQRAELMRAVKQSPVVYKILETERPIVLTRCSSAV